MRNLLLSGGYEHAHDFAATSAAHADNWAQVGIDTTITDDVEAGLVDLAAGGYDLVTVNMLRWTMAQEFYAAHRARSAFSLSAASQLSLTDFVRSGGGLVALHTASICFDDWAGWADLVGAAWDWAASSHPPLGDVHVEVSTDVHPVTAGVDDFVVTDEIYSDLAARGDRTVLASAQNPDARNAGAQPLIWVRPVGAGRVFHDALGHDATSVCQAGHATILRQGARWAAGAAVAP